MAQLFPHAGLQEVVESVNQQGIVNFAQKYGIKMPYELDCLQSTSVSMKWICYYVGYV